MSTYVLVHGSWHGAWCWFKITARLRAAGHTVVVPDMPGHGRDFGTANCEFQRHGGNRTGRQSHTWMRTPEGWRIVAAHVSLLGEATVMKS